MTPLPPFRRDMLTEVFNGNQRMVSAFEDLLNALTQTVKDAESGAAASLALQNAAVVLLAADAALLGGRVLTEGAGIALADDGTRVTVSLNDLTPKINGGHPVNFLVSGDTNLILPVVGQLATLKDITSLISGAVTSFNTRTGAITLLSADVTGALGYTPTSVTGLTGVQSVAAFKTGLSLVKGDVGLGSVDNTADAAKFVMSASKLTTARAITITGDVSWTVSFDGSAAASAAGTIQAGVVTLAKMANLAANSFIGNNTGSAATPIALTVAQAKTLLAIAAADVSGLAAIATSGSASDLSAGTVAAARMPALTGDITTSVGAVATTLATVNTNTGAWGSATQSPQITLDGKGRATAAANVTITPAFSSITGKPTTLSGYGITDAQPLDSDLTTIAGLTATTDNFIVSVASAWASRTPTQVRSTLGLVIGTNVQAWDADLDTLAGLTATTDNFIVSVSSAWASRTPAQVRTTLGLVIGTNVQAWDADLDAIAALASAANKVPYSTGAQAWALADFTAAGRALVDDADAAAQRTTLGLGTAATQTYTDGAWTPVLNFGGATTGITYSTQQGSYRRIGNLITVFMEITLSSKGSATGSATITGLPFTTAAAPRGNNPILHSNMTSVGQIFGQFGASGTTINVFNCVSGSAVAFLTDTNFQNTSLLQLTASYPI